ncbi:MAG: signal peptidase I [Candidatus Omnitrophica bacterium]|nr:signal peptidase I [Candidatus Omnitrophota bacterium]
MDKDLKTKKNKNKRSVIREWVESIIVAFILAMIIRTFVVQAFKIPSASMEPTLLVGDHILVNKFIYGLRIPFLGKRILFLGTKKPTRGEVIVFIYPQEPKKNFIKRLVAFGGERVKIKNGMIYINGQPLNDDIFGRFYYYNRGTYGVEEEIVVPPNCYYVLGDNSFSSQDSRYWGFVPDKNILGKAFLIYFPLSRIRLIR